jgi:hypothetical protein
MKTSVQFLLSVFVLSTFTTCLAQREEAPRSVRPAGRFHPGHYVAVGVGDDMQEIRHLDEPAIRGVSKRYFWRTLEPEQGIYNFSEIENDLAFLEQHGKQLVIFLMDKTFSRKSPLPRYLADRCEYHSDYDGFTPARWQPFFQERLLALGQALGERFDSRPGLEGVAIQESSLAVTDEGRDVFGYTPERYRDALITILTGLQAAFPRSHVFWYQNFLHGNNDYLRHVADAVGADGVFMGGPDILPHRRYLSRVSYPLYEDYRTKLTLFCSAQTDSYRHHKNDRSVDEVEPVHPDGFLSMKEIFLFARDRLHVRYIFWDHEYGLTEPDARTYDDAIKVIRKNPTFNETKGPR